MVLNRNVRPRPRPKLRQLLGQSDFTYLGYYDVVDGFTAAGLGSGLAHRYLSSVFTGMYVRSAFASQNPVRYFTLPVSFGQQCTLGNIWSDPWNGMATDLGAQRWNIWWDETNSRLWSTFARDYPNLPTGQGDVVAGISTRQADSAGTVSNWHGYWGFQGIGHRAIYGGVRSVPQWFQNTYNTGPYLAGFGGYSSEVNQGLTPSLGPMLVFFPDPHGVYTEETNLGTVGIPSTDFKIGADHRSGTDPTDWFTNYAGRTKDRGIRRTLTCTNWFDGNDSRSNPLSRPTYPTDRSGTNEWWVGDGGGAAPNDPSNYGRWNLGDTHDGCLEWIDNAAGTRLRHGIVTVASLGDGYVWYQGSDLHFDDKTYEIHVYNPTRIAEVMAGSRQVYDLRPDVAFSITPLLEGVPTGTGNGSFPQTRHIGGSTFDATTNRLYLALYGVPNGINQAKLRLYVFQVGGA